MESNNNFFRELIYLFNAHRKYNMQRFHSLGLSTGQPKVLSILLTNEGYVQKDLAERCMVEPATMTTLLRRMEASGLIYKKAVYGANGKRAMSVFLTDKGRELAEKVEMMARESDELCLSSLNEEEKEALCESMRKARNALEDKLAMEETERKRMLWKQITGTIISLFAAIIMVGCSSGVKTPEPSEPEATATPTAAEQITETVQNNNEPEEDIQVTLTKAYKGYENTNPILTQHFGADPYGMEYDGRLYIYMTADAFELDSQENIKENSYSKIRSIYVASTDDMVNFTDHGEIPVAGHNGIAKWASNSWAPAACWKMIDGKPKFFLYFADNGGGIGVLTSDSPTGPFEDPIGKALISRYTPNCGNVTWLFDPAVLVDDDGTGYIYFGGGVPEGKASAPGTGRVAKLGADMTSIDGEAVSLDVPYLFEDSGIHKFNNKYYYTYCTNWNVDDAGTKEYGIHNGEIACMVSDSPMGPFTFSEVILKNPGTVFTLWGNNHHCVCKFRDDWYIVYHARTVEKAMQVEKGYRSTHIEKINIAEDGSIGQIKMTYAGPECLANTDPFKVNSATDVALMAGVEAYDSASIRYPSGIASAQKKSDTDENFTVPEYAPAPSACGGYMYAAGFDAGDYIEIRNADLGEGGEAALQLYLRGGNEGDVFELFVDDPAGEVLAKVSVPAGEYTQFSAFDSGKFTLPAGIHNLFIVCARGEGVDMASWRLVK